MGVTVLGVHYRDTKNIGDRYCHPLDYVSYERSMDDSTIRCDVRHLPDNVDPDVVVIGGGAIARHCPELKSIYPNAVHIAWGIGITRADLTQVNASTHEKFASGYSLYGCRDYRAMNSYVPCASCLHPIFDTDFDVMHDVVVYGHAGKKPLKDEADRLGLPYMENNDASGFEGVIRFLASGKTVVTSSYHGAYWAALLDKKVSVIPFGSKFYSLRNLPPLVENISEGIENALDFPSALQEARGITHHFSTHVGNIVDSLRTV